MNARAHRIIFDRARGLWLAVAENVRTCRAGARSGAAAVLLSAWGASGLAVAQTLPGGGAVVQGAGSIEAAGSAMVVRQDSARMVADWQSFSIGSGASVRFVQPSTSAVALNRVVGSDPSSIFGSLTSNGHVYLQNPNGVLFAPGARVDVGSLVATTLKADMPSFLDGRLRLSGDGGAAVINQGQIQAAAGGSVVLAGPQVANHGRIVVPGGTIALAAGQAVNVDATGSGLLSIEVPLAAIGARLDHSGFSQADGGLVSLQAAAADAARRTVMRVDGVVRARRIEQRGGQIVLAGGPSGDVLVGAQLDVSAADGRGGELQVLGERVALVDQASLDARGAAGGGSVLVGGNLQGHGPQPNASTTMVGAGVAIDASATQSGDGGQVIVWSDGHTGFAGTLRATGGPAGGNGGFAEVSGKRTLDFQGQVDLRAPHGRQGTLLLDPDFIVIGTVADVNGDGNFDQEGPDDDLPSHFLFVDSFPGVTSLITAGRVAELLFTADVLLQAEFGIEAVAPLFMAPGGALSTLRLEAPSVAIHASMDLANSSLAISTPSLPQEPGSVSIDADVRSLGSVSINAANISLLGGVVSAPLVRLDSNQPGSGSVFQSGSHAIHADTLVAGAFGSAFEFVDLFGGDNQLRTVFLGANSAYLHNANNGFRFDLGGTVSVLDVEAISGIVQTTPIVSDHLSIVTSDPDPVTGAVDLGLPTNDIGQVGFSVGGRFNLRTQGDLAVDRVFVSISETDLDTTAGGSISLEAGGRFTLLSSIQATGVSGPATIDIRSVGFDNTGGGLLLAPGGRFLVKSDDFTADNFGPIGFGRTSTDFGFVVYDGFAGEVPTSGNGLITNQAGALTIDPADLGPISRPYDGTTAFTASLDVTTPGAGTSAVAFVPPGSVSLLPVVGYQVELNGNFDTRHAGVDKGFSLVASQGTAVHGADGAGAQVDYYGLQLAPFVRPAGPSAAFPESRVTPLPVAVTGLVANDKVYDASTVATLSGTPVLNLLAGDIVSLAGAATGSFVDKQVGVDKPVSADGLSLVGADAGNYTLISPTGLSASIAAREIAPSGIRAIDRVADGQTRVELDTSLATLVGLLPGDLVTIDARNAFGQIDSPEPGAGKPVTLVGLAIAGNDAVNYRLDLTPAGPPVTVTVVPALRAVFEELRFKEYLQGVSDAQEPFRRAMAEALAAGFGKENIRKRLSVGLVFETGLAVPAIDDIQPAKGPGRCTLGGAGNGLALSCP